MKRSTKELLKRVLTGAAGGIVGATLFHFVIKPTLVKEIGVSK